MDLLYVFFFKQKTAYEMRISDWSSDVCSSDLGGDDAIDHRIVDPGGESRDDRGDVVLHDRTIRKRVPGSLDPCGQNITRTIVRRGACVGYGENRDPDWEERGCVVNRPWRSSSRAACRPYGSATLEEHLVGPPAL